MVILYIQSGMISTNLLSPTRVIQIVSSWILQSVVLSIDVLTFFITFAVITFDARWRRGPLITTSKYQRIM